MRAEDLKAHREIASTIEVRRAARHRVSLPEGTKAKHLRFTALHVLEKNNVTIAEIGVVIR